MALRNGSVDDSGIKLYLDVFRFTATNAADVKAMIEGIFDYICENHESFWEEAMNRGVTLNDVYLPPPEDEEDAVCAANAETTGSMPISVSTLK